MSIREFHLKITACLFVFYLYIPAHIDAKELPLPAFPANFEVAVYKGQQGCIPDNDKYQFAVMENEGLVAAGMHPLIATAKTGAHIMNYLYQPKKNYGYTLSIKKDGKQCIYNKIKNMKFKNEVTTNLFSDVNHKVTKSDCDFDVKAVNLCGSFKAVTTRMTKAGYQFDWSGKIAKGYTLTLITKGEQSFYLKTKNSTAATIITGVGKGAYKHYAAPSANRG